MENDDTQSSSFHSGGRNKVRHRRLAALLAGTALFGFTSAAAGQAMWTGTTSGDWGNATNWTTPPNAATDVIISDMSSNTPVISAIIGDAAGLTVSGAPPTVLTVTNGGVLNSQSPSFIGFGNGEDGRIAVENMSSWTSHDNMFVGFDGNGDVTITGASTVTANASAYLGFGEQGFGAAKVLGAGSSWDVANTLVVGLAGDGVLFAQGGSVASGEAYLGAETGSDGTVTITDNSSWTNTGSLQIGVDGTGRLSVYAGSAVTSGVTALGVTDGASGLAVVNAVGSNWAVTDNLAVGAAGVGNLFVNNDGQMSVAGDVLAGLAESGYGYIAVEDGGILNITGSLVAGADGSATVKVQDGGTMTSAGAIAGVGDEGLANIAVSGFGSGWGNSGTLELGVSGAAQLSISDGAGVTNDSAILGVNGAGIVTVDKASWINAGDVTIGQFGAGKLEIRNGGIVSNWDAMIGNQVGSGGSVVVEGGGSQWLVDQDLLVGHAGDALLEIRDGGSVDSAISGGTADIGIGSGTGSVNISGTGSSWTNNGVLRVGGGGMLMEPGQGELTVSDSGQFTNNGIAYLGYEAGSFGAATVDGGTWTNTSSLFVGREGNGLLTIENDGSVTATHATIAAEPGSAGKVTVDGTGLVWSMSGTLGIGRYGDAELSVGENAIVVAQNAVLAAFQPGSSALVKVDGVLAGLGGVTFNVGSHLSGTGTVSAGAAGTTTMNGTIAPGNSIGTLFVIGNYVQNAGSTYEVEIDAAGNSDLIDVSGAATLNGGEVVIVPFPDVALATPYTILTAAGGVTGQFDPITNSLSYFLSPELTYDPNNVYLTIQQSATFESAAMTPNQIATAQGADSLPSSNPVWTAIAMLPDAPTAQFAFDQLSGEVHGSVQSALIDDSRFVRDAALNRIRDAFAGVGAAQTPVFAYGDDGPELAAPDTDKLALWAHGFGSWGHWDSDGNAAQLDRSIGGLFVGGDAPLADWRVGALAGYSRSNLDVDARASSASVESWHLGLYGGTQWGDFAFRTGAAYSWHDISTARTATFPGFADSLTGDYSAGTGQIFGELAYGMDSGAYRFEPFANLAYVHQSRSGFTEQGGPAALTASSASTDTAFTTLGLRGATEIDLDGTTLTAHATLGWRHAFGDVTPTSTHAFAGGAPFTIAGTPIARDAAVIEAGLDLRFTPQASLGLSYSGQLAGNAQSHGFSAKLGVSF